MVTKQTGVKSSLKTKVQGEIFLSWSFSSFCFFFASALQLRRFNYFQVCGHSAFALCLSPVLEICNVSFLFIYVLFRAFRLRLVKLSAKPFFV